MAPTILEKLEYIRRNLSREDMYMGLAEEAAELSAVASKMVRIIRGTNPAALTQQKCFEKVFDEFCDVLNVAEVLYLGSANIDQGFVDTYRFAKINRWYNRLKKQKEGKNE